MAGSGRLHSGVGIVRMRLCGSGRTVYLRQLSRHAWHVALLERRRSLRPSLGDSGGLRHAGQQQYQAELKLFDFIPVKTVSVSVVPERTVIPCGTPFGIKMFTNGVMVVGIAEIQTEQGMENPAEQAGIRTGDILVSVDGNAVNRNEEIAALVEQSGGKPITICYRREDTEHTTQLTPAKSMVDGQWKAGLWVRDSTAGIGTLTFTTRPRRNSEAWATASAIRDTSKLMPFLNGEILPVTISGVTKEPAAPPESCMATLKATKQWA